MGYFILRHKIFFIVVLSLLIIKVIWVIWSCWGNGSFEKEKNELLQRRNFLVGKVVVEPRQLLNEMPSSIGLQFQGEWALYSCSKLTEALSNMVELYPETRGEAIATVDNIIQIVKSPELRLYDKLRWDEVSLKDIVNCYANLARFNKDFPLNDSIAIYQMLDAMRDVNRPDQLDWSRAGSVQNIAWKTGTSYGARDGWAIGITPEYVVGVWTGNADGSGVADLTGARTAGPVMFDIFNLLPSCGWFAEPMGTQEKICTHSGHRAGRYCKDTRIERIAQNGSKSKECPYCTEIPVSIDGLRRVIDASEPTVMKSFFQLPPVHKYYYIQSHADYIEPPVNILDSESSMRFIYPANGAVVSLPRRADNNQSQLICKAVHSNSNAELFWHLDNNFIGSTRDIHQVQITPSIGVHKLTIFDNFGAQKTIEIIIK